MVQEERRPVLSVIIPMYNEEGNVETTLGRMQQTLQTFGRPYEIIPVNDGSTDDTLRVLDEMASQDGRIRVVSYWKNGGRGKALRYGFKAARGEYIATIDADLSYDPRYILDMIRVLDEESDIDVVLAEIEILERDCRRRLKQESLAPPRSGKPAGKSA